MWTLFLFVAVFSNALLLPIAGAQENNVGDCQDNTCSASDTTDELSLLQSALGVRTKGKYIEKQKHDEEKVQDGQVASLIQDQQDDAISKQERTTVLLSPEAQTVRDCFTAQSAREEQAAKENAAVGIVGSLFAIGSGLVKAVCDTEQKSLVQTQENVNGVGRRSDISPTAKLAAGCAAVSVIGDVYDAAVTGKELADKLADNSPNCLEDAAVATMEKIDKLATKTKESMTKLSEDVTEVGNALGRLDTKLDDVAASLETTLGTEIKDASTASLEKMTASLRQGEAGQWQMRQLETKLFDQMRDQQQDMATLALKLDNLMKKVLENGEKIEESTYSTLSTTFSSALAGVSGAYSDFELALDLLNTHNSKLLKASSSRDVLQWGMDGKSVREVAQTNLQLAWQRARDNTATVVSTLENGGLMELHYDVAIKMVAHKYISNLGTDCKDFLGNAASFTAFMTHLQTEVFEKDSFLPSILNMITMLSGIHDVLRHAVPTMTSVTKDLLEVVSGAVTAVDKQRMAFSSDDTPLTLAQMLSVILPIQCPMTPECIAAASAKGIANTDQLVMWNAASKVVALSPSRLMVDQTANNNVFFTCTDAPMTRPAMNYNSRKSRTGDNLWPIGNRPYCRSDTSSNTKRCKNEELADRQACTRALTKTSSCPDGYLLTNSNGVKLDKDTRKYTCDETHAGNRVHARRIYTWSMQSVQPENSATINVELDAFICTLAANAPSTIWSESPSEQTAFEFQTDYHLVTESLKWNSLALYLKDWYSEITKCVDGECNWQCYLDRYPDLGIAFKKGGKTTREELWAEAEVHYVSHGGPIEGRDCTCPVGSCR